jgi:DNA-binding beta-propeller fold protein YncE
MKRLFLDRSAIGVISVLVGILFGTVSCSQSSSTEGTAKGSPAAASVVNFIATDEPGPWFKCVGNGCVPAGTESLAIVAPNTVVKISIGKETNTVHTFTSLLYPTGATNMPFDQSQAFGNGSKTVRLVDPGLYVFVCKLHPFMLAATIVDDPATTDVGGLDGTVGGPAYDLGENITLINNLSALPIPTTSNLAARLLRAFFLITNPANYQDHNGATNPGNTWSVPLPGVVVQATGGAQLLLSDLSIVNQALPILSNPGTPGIGEVWIDLEYEKTGSKTKPGTAAVVDTNTWKVTRKVALPGINMNNPHNMWASADQSVIYQTQWFDNKLTAFDRASGIMLQNIVVGHSPAHVMTRVDTDQVHVSINGGGEVVELSALAAGINRHIRTQNDATENPAQPHAHWMSHDGKIMVTPNSNTADSTRIDIPTGTIVAKTLTGTLPIATGMMPDASKYYVSNYLDSTITCISIDSGACKGAGPDGKKTINLLLGGTTFANYDHIDGSPDMSAAGALPIQTPVSPNGKYVVTANTLSGTITVINTSTDTLVAVLPCSAGCHGVNFGAKSGLAGGYYAYVSSKFSNDLIVVDPDPNNDGSGADAEIAGRILLTSDANTTIDDALGVTAFAGMGGQGVLPIPNVYNGWVQKLPNSFCTHLSAQQRNPLGNLPSENCP